MPKTKKTYILYGLFGIVIIFIAYWGFNFLKGTSIFNKTYDYYVYYDRVEGLNTSSTVTVNGFKVGQVAGIELLPKDNQRLKVTIQITNEFLLPDSTVARIYSMDLLGSKAVELKFGSSTNNYHKPGDVLIGEVEQSLMDQVSVQMLPIKHQAEKLMGEISNVIEIISSLFTEQTRDDIEKSFSSIRNTLAHIEHASYEFDTMLINETTKISKIISNIEFITRSLRDNDEQISNFINNISDFSDTLLTLNISETIFEAHSILAKVDSIVERVEKGEGSLGQLLNDNKLAAELESSAESLDKLLKDIRNNPKKYVSFSLLRIGRTVNLSDESELTNKDYKAIEKQKEKEEKMLKKNMEKEGGKD